ncbi:MAG: hypothetical protein ACE5MB_11330 [Anaerolineae bacterium]
MDILTLELPKDLLALLQKRAAEREQELQEVALQILRKELAAEGEPESERERVIQALQASGLVRPLSEELVNKYVRLRSPAEREKMRRRLEQKTFTPPLSEIIIQDRGAL